MARIFLELSYCGTAYHGWQIQPNATTVQGLLDGALTKIYGTPLHSSGCSRTDAGVHARRFYCHFDTDKPFELSRLPDALNSQLPRDISVLDAKEVSEEMHSRFSVKNKTYEYLIWNEKRRNALYCDKALHYPYALNVEAMKKGAKYFEGTHDFSAFMAQGSQVSTTVRTVFSAKVEEKDGFLCFSVTGDGFLYNMVRIMVGTVLYVGQGKIAPEDIPDIIASGDRTKAGPTAEPVGLYLAKVEY